MNERLCGCWTGSELHNGRGGGKDVVAVAAVVDCLSIGALFCQWVAQKCCSISMYYAADTEHFPTTRVAPAVAHTALSKWPQIAEAIANYVRAT